MVRKHIPLFAAGRSECGNARPENEDAFCVCPSLFVVADGVGGAPKGEVASRMAVEIISVNAQVQPDAPHNPSAMRALLSGAIQTANRAIYNKSITDEEHFGMGTTVVAANVVGNLAVIAHVGDSRAYLWRFAPGALHCLTRDHNLGNSNDFTGGQTKSGVNLTRFAGAENQDWEQILTRSLGSEREVTVDVGTLALDKDDALLLCSDGLTNLVPDDEIARAFQDHLKPREIVNALINAALRNGGNDNVTAVVCGLGELYQP